MHIIRTVFLLAAASFSAACRADSCPSAKELDEKSDEFREIVNYLDFYVSKSDIKEILDVLPEACSVPFEVSSSELEGRSVTDYIPWEKILDKLNELRKGNSKFSRLVNLLMDPRFQELVRKTYNSETLRQFLIDTTTFGFSWVGFFHLLFHAAESVALTFDRDRPSTEYPREDL